MNSFWTAYFFIVVFLTQMVIFWRLNRISDFLYTITDLLTVKNKQDELFESMAERFEKYKAESELIDRERKKNESK